jgi:type I restriction enzyme, S subunit
MNSWLSKKMSEITCLVTDGKHGDCEDEDGSGYFFLSSKDLREGKLNYDKPRQITHAGFLETHRRTNLEPGDVLLTNCGASIGRVGIAQNDPRIYRTTFQKSISVIKPDRSLVDGRYLYYFLLCNSRLLIDLGDGTAQPNLLIGDLKRIDVPVPPSSVQRRIVGILWAYDDLIENNQRRIKILEETARSLYREWFVNFRFPGHEKVPLVDSALGTIPRGWEVTNLAAQLAALESGKRPKGGIRDVEDGVPSIGAENINGIGRHDFESEKFVSREFFQEMRNGVVRDRDVAIYKDGAYIGKSSYFRDGFPHSECCVNEHVFLLRANGVRLKQNALYLWLQEPDTVHAIRATNANAAQPGINQKSVGGLELILPDENTAAHFDRLVESLLAEIINLAKRIQNLRRTRDLLLPRLLSGRPTSQQTEP